MRAIEEIIDPRHISVKRSRHGVEDPHQPVYSLAVAPRQRLAALPVPMHGPNPEGRADSGYLAASGDVRQWRSLYRIVNIAHHGH